MKLFVYGHLQKAYSPEPDQQFLRRASVRGWLFDRQGDDPALLLPKSPAVFATVVDGELHEVPDETVTKLIREEEGYELKPVRLMDGEKVHTFAWTGALPKDPQWIRRWSPKENYT